MRVAYLVDLDDCPDALLDAIFAEAYGRWGGRRTLIVPATADGVDSRYTQWLYYFDPDVVYSFVDLSDAVALALHERYAPAHLIRHRDWRRPTTTERNFQIELPLKGLSSLSVLPMFLSRSSSFDGPPRNIRVLSKYWDRTTAPFLFENFGFLSASFVNGAVGSAYPDLYSTLTLITDAALSDRRLGKDNRATYVTSEDQVLEALGSGGGPMTLAQLSDYFAPYLDLGRTAGPQGTCIIVGDTPSDRLLFWNIHHRFERLFPSEITALRIPAARLADVAFVERINQILSLHGTHNNGGQNLNLISCSLEREALDAIASQLRQGKTWLNVTVSRHADHAAVVPRFRDGDLVHYRLGGFTSDPEGRGSAEFRGNRAPVPLVCPWHIKEALPPAGLRSGNWMLDLSIDREVDHCLYANVRHSWLLPRRLRIERSFDYEREGARAPDLDGKLIRTLRSGQLSIALNVGISRASISVPDDLSAIRIGICNDWEWVPFDRDREAGPHGRLRFAAAELSDKGRYLTGVLQLFDRVPDAFSVLMDGYWRDVFHHLGGVPTDSELEKQQKLLQVLRRRTGQMDGPLNFAGDDQLNRLARESLRAGRMIAKEKRFIQYGQLLRRWEEVVEAYIRRHPSPGKDDLDDRIRDVRYLDESVQHLCQHEVLFQGREWRCRSCYNRNWVGVDELGRTLSCSVCGRDEPAPVSGSWQFCINPFILEAYRDHGIEAVVWALWRLLYRSKSSFYFVPSLKLWLSYPDGPSDTCDAEVDAVAVVDGEVYLVEAKSSAGLAEGEVAQLLLAAERIRPDVLMVACMNESSGALDRTAQRLRGALPAEIKVEVLTFNSAELDRRPFLPS